jgi:shikimate 5-dehydrogenase
MIHNGAFKRLGWNAVYLAFEVKHLEEALRGIRGLGVRGMSVTHPFKTEVIPFLDKVEKLAKKIGAVNTIVHRGGRLLGYNTDCDGALEGGREDGFEREKGGSSWGRGCCPGDWFWSKRKRLSNDHCQSLARSG